MSSGTAKKILKQVEFYFSDSNLPRDKFLSEITGKSEEGWCPIETIASFQRMKKITEDLSVVVAALKESSFLVVSEDDKNIRRKEPLPADKVDTTPKSIYVKGFGEEATLEEVQAFIEKEMKEGEKLLLTRMRRMKGGEMDKKFKGSVFLEFDSVATAERMSKATLKLKEDGEPMEIMMKAEYVAKKKAEIAEKRAAKKAKAGGNSGNKRKVEEEEQKEEEITKDLIVEVASLTGEDCSREDLKAKLEEAGGSVTYVEYARGQTSGYLRLKEESKILATELCTKLMEAETEVCGCKPVFKALTGEEEASYWRKVRENQKNRKSKARPKRQRR